MAKLYAPKTGSDRATTAAIFCNVSRMPNRSVRYASVIFQKNNVAENKRYTMLNKIPGILVVLGGGRTTYNKEVLQNQVSVGMSVYPHPITTFFRSGFTPSIRPVNHSVPTQTANVNPVAAVRTMN